MFLQTLQFFFYEWYIYKCHELLNKIIKHDKAAKQYMYLRLNNVSSLMGLSHDAYAFYATCISIKIFNFFLSQEAL